jgi:fatty acid desaturase
MSQEHIRRMPKGYAANRSDVRAFIAQHCQPYGWIAGAYLLMYYLSIIIAVAIGAYAWATFPRPAALLVYGIVHVCIARQLLALFLMLHDGAHGNLTRAKVANDRLTAILLGAPLSIEVKRYREGHKGHHTEYGSPADPGRVFHELLAVESWPRTTLWAYLSGLLIRLPLVLRLYSAEHTASLRTVAFFVLWHLLVVMLPLAVLLTPGTALALWLAFWALPMAVTFPTLRVINETDAHVYNLGSTEFDSSVANEGAVARWLTHPYHDVLHHVHHIWPSVPYYRHQRLHAFLRLNDADYRNRYRHRRKVLQNPMSAGLTAVSVIHPEP